ncbi:MAG: hypothetical protein J1E77_04850 [Prevotella sp.]|nr:hypothetical protein [Prevotella sp.]
MLPVQKPDTTFRSLEEIRLRKEELYDQLQSDSQQASALWNKVFVKRQDSTRSEFIGSMVSNGIAAVDAILLIRKLMKSYRHIFKRKS